MQIGIGSNYYANVHGYVHGVYNLTGQQFVLGGVSLDFVWNGISIGSVTTDTSGYYDFNFTMGPDSAWGYNKTIEVVMSATDMQFTNFSGIIYLHANSSEWFNGSMTFMSTVNILGFELRVPKWFTASIGELLGSCIYPAIAYLVAITLPVVVVAAVLYRSVKHLRGRSSNSK